MKKLLCIQPHSDDVLFSASHFLFYKQKYSTEVLTVENNTKRVSEDERLYSFLGIPYHHLQLQFDDQSFYSFHKKYAEVNSQNAVEHLTNFFGEETVRNLFTEISMFVKSFQQKYPDVQIVVPWGVGHPMHVFVRDTVEAASNNALWYYRDFPHSYKKRARSQIQSQLSSYKLLQSVPVIEFHDVKWALAKKFYHSQSGLLWYEQGYIRKQLPEEIYVKK